MTMELEAVGRRIGELRRAAGWRLVDLAEVAGYTTSYLSQIERGVCIPSLTALATLAVALDVEMSELLAESIEPTVTITRAGEGSRLTRSDGQWWRIIGPLGANLSYTATIQDFQPGSTRFRHFGERFILVMSGAIQMTIGEETHELGPLESIHYGAHEDHTLSAVSPENPECLILSSPALV